MAAHATSRGCVGRVDDLLRGDRGDIPENAARMRERAGMSLESLDLDEGGRLGARDGARGLLKDLRAIAPL
jgi:hypothetical protein